jgi:FAD/FMN-containing dehydrogenase
MSATRREFLRRLAYASVAARTATLPLMSCGDGATAKFDALSRRLPGSVLRPGAEGYTTFTAPWNLRWTGKRAVAQAVVRATSAADVASTIRWATETNTPMVARSGGHSYTGYSTTEGVVVDVSLMNGVKFDESTKRVTLGGGVRNRDAYASLKDVSRTITHGRCYGVGVAGLVLGGGIGFNMRRFGLTCDQLVSTEMVLANGETVQASATENSDLFWAARGAGGGNFGIHTSFVFDTFPAEQITIFERTYANRVDEVLLTLLDVSREAPRALGLKFNVRVKRGPAGDNVISLQLLGQWAGPESDLRAFLAPLDAIAAPESSGYLRSEAYWEGQKSLSDEGEPEFMYERSRYVQKKLGADVVGVILDKLRAWPSTSTSATFKGFLTGGKISEVAPDATAFVHRRDWLLSTIDLGWTTNDAPEKVLASLEWLDGFHDAMGAHTSNESYQNFIDESQTDWQRAYHGANLEKLVDIKKKVDAKNVFSFPQSIPVSM